ncbi:MULTISPECIES: SMR family transporter [unclassified Leptolyngbya]|uniref:SMR family transporter n=1 Tax=unclassified Leptolyngbya TaxID=2650499 RepID=UPI00168A10EE|nr:MULTISPECIES: SMR family transporter [unclassified Leptolyngbya]MBD1909879.1 small multidrug resistance protein [Leptolyngbya sp. FACHB-8]MBD2156975.1 small multidrug resistance protein [Leptolyngbya sp. FACHB-16]
MPFYLLSGLLVLITVALNTLAQALLKLGSGQNPVNPYLLGGILAYGLSTVFYIAVLGKFNLSVAYPIIIGLTVLSTTVTGAFLLGEKVATVHWLGIGLMLSGISAIAAGTK